MEHRFEKQSIFADFTPMALMLALGAMFAVFAVFSNTLFLILGCAAMAILFAFFPIMMFRYLRSFDAVTVAGNAIKVSVKKEAMAFTVPADLRRVKIDADDLEIELKNNGRRFVVRTRFLKNKDSFHQLFDQMIKEHPPSEDKVILKASVLEIMQRIKNS